MAANATLFIPFSCLLLLFSLLLSLYTIPSGAADAILPGRSLSGTQTISSGNGTFELGFFSPGNSSRNWYLCVRFKSIRPRTIVWVANRETPLSDPASSELRLSSDGVLVLLDHSKQTQVIWSSNSSSSPLTTKRPNTTTAVLLETGNFVLRDGSAETSMLLWQSFDQPGDTLLPGAKLGYNGTEGKSWKLVSWKNKEDPSPGLYSLEFDPSGVVQVIIRRNESQTYWSSGAWNGRIFSLTPEMLALNEYGINGFASANATYFSYVDHEVGGLSTMWMDVSGRWMWQKWIESTQEWSVFSFMPRDPCVVYQGCGPFSTCSVHNTPYCDCLPGFEPTPRADWSLGDTSGGCGRKTPLLCGSNSSAGGAQSDGFLKLSNIRLPSNPLPPTVSSAQECEQACANNCSCTAYAYNGSACSVWGGGLQNVKQLADGEATGSSAQVGELFLRLAAAELPRPGKKKTSFLPALLGALGGSILLLLVITILVWRHHRRPLTAKALAAQGFLVPFRYRDLRRATKNFSEKLGKGGFGSVFKGTLPDNTVVAVKMLEGLRQGDKQFRMEVAAMAAVQHLNVVRLRGFCSEGAKRLLVVDYMPNRSLDCYLFPKSSQGLDWGRRFQVALGAARGLAYLHEKCRDCIIHCDVKPENILLDGDFQPKVADFGLAKLVGRDFSRVLTTMRGTVGYLAPEWITGVPITPKADVYSYGMMLFEIISGRRNGEEPQEEGRPSFFPAWVATEVNCGACEVASEQGANGCVLEDGAAAEELRRACRVACWCVQAEEADRPSMGQVVQMLEGVVEVEMPPVPKLLQNHVASGEEIVYFLEMCSFVSSKTSTIGSSTQSN